jgi:hypothetical protein
MKRLENVATDRQIRELVKAAREMLQHHPETRHATHDQKRAQDSLAAALAAFPMRYWE